MCKKAHFSRVLCAEKVPGSALNLLRTSEKGSSRAPWPERTPCYCEKFSPIRSTPPPLGFLSVAILLLYIRLLEMYLPHCSLPYIRQVATASKNPRHNQPSTCVS